MNKCIEPVSLDEISAKQIELEKVLKLRLHRRKQVIVLPTFLEGYTLDYDGIYFSKKRMDILLLILIYYFSDWFGIFKEYIRYEIEVYLKKNLLFPELLASLVDKRICLAVLLNSRYNARDLFSILSEENLNKVLGSLLLRRIKDLKPRYSARKRGYNDKGSLRAETKVPEEPDCKAHLRLEADRKLYSDCVGLIVHEVGGWVLQDLFNESNLNEEMEEKL